MELLADRRLAEGNTHHEMARQCALTTYLRAVAALRRSGPETPKDRSTGAGERASYL